MEASIKYMLGDKYKGDLVLVLANSEAFPRPARPHPIPSPWKEQDLLNTTHNDSKDVSSSSPSLLLTHTCGYLPLLITARTLLDFGIC